MEEGFETNINIAKSGREAAIRRAKALRTLSKAEADYLESLNEQIPADRAADVLIADKYLLGFEPITDNEADKVFLPNNLKGGFDLDTQTQS